MMFVYFTHIFIHSSVIAQKDFPHSNRFHSGSTSGSSIVRVSGL